MDINSGAYLDGAPMAEVGRQAFGLLLSVAGGVRSRGEQAGHAQVQLWRAWPQSDGSRLQELRARAVPSGLPLALAMAGQSAPAWTFSGWLTAGRPAAERVGLVLPGSLCSAQVARLAAARLTERQTGGPGAVDRFVALPHTEGCGVAGPGTDELFGRVVLGHLAHPSVRAAVVLEHGCEKAHNDYVRQRLADYPPVSSPLGWASVQLDGGNAAVLERIEDWFAEALTTTPAPTPMVAGLEVLCLGLTAVGPIGEAAAAALAQLVRWVVGAGGTVVVPANAACWAVPRFVADLGLVAPLAPTLGHGQRPEQPGLHLMDAPSADWGETLSGLGAAGPHLLLAHVGGPALAGHPLVPLIQFATDPGVIERHGDDLDLCLGGNAEAWAATVLTTLGDTASRRRRACAMAADHWVFQVTRGRLGVTM